ncbi:hypothetical protein MRX96_034623 [Rhipicephalus microplus]
MLLRSGKIAGSRLIQPPQFVCSVCPNVSDPGTWDTHTGRLGPRSARSGRHPFQRRRHKQVPSDMLQVWRPGPLQKPVPKQTKPWLPEKQPRPAMASACRSPANILPPPVSSHFTQSLEILLRASTWTRARIQEQLGESQRPPRRVYCSSHHPAARKHGRWKPSAKEHMPKEIKPHSIPLEQLPGNQGTNAPTECPPTESHGLL